MSAIFYLLNKRTGEVHRLYQRVGGRYALSECELERVTSGKELSEDEALRTHPDNRHSACWEDGEP